MTTGETFGGGKPKTGTTPTNNQPPVQTQNDVPQDVMNLYTPSNNSNGNTNQNNSTPPSDLNMNNVDDYVQRMVDSGNVSQLSTPPTSTNPKQEITMNNVENQIKQQPNIPNSTSNPTTSVSTEKTSAVTPSTYNNESPSLPSKIGDKKIHREDGVDIDNGKAIIKMSGDENKTEETMDEASDLDNDVHEDVVEETKGEVEQKGNTTIDDILSLYNGDGKFTDTETYKNLVRENETALSRMNQAQQQALKYADMTAQAMGYSTQGARQQVSNDILNMYSNAISNQNSNYLNTVGTLADEYENNQKALQREGALLDYELKNQEEQKAYDRAQDEYSKQIYEDEKAYEREQDAKAEATQKSTESITNFQNLALSAYESNPNITEEELRELYEDYSSTMTEGDKATSEAIINEIVSSQETSNTEQAVSEGRYEGLTSKNGSSYDVTFANGLGINKNFIVNVNGNSYEVEMGNQADAYLSGVTKQKVFVDAKDKQIGDIWEVKNDKGKSVLVIKTGNTAKDIRVIEKAGVSLGDYAELCKALGYDRTKNKQ